MVKLNDLQKHELIDWSDEIEEILRTLSEKSQIWRLLHMNNHDIFKRKYYCLVIPVTILSSITGAANLALGSVASGNETVINLVIGALGIIISVISTLNNIFSFQKRKDEHFRAAKDWYRVQRMIDIELSLQKVKRNDVSVFFHLVLQEIERIHEFHPNIRDDVVKKFMKRYKNKKLNIDIPEILSIRKTIVFKDDIVVNNTKIDIKNDNTQIHNKPILTPNLNNKKPSFNKQGTFLNMNDDSDKSESIEDSLIGIDSINNNDHHDHHDHHDHNDHHNDLNDNIIHKDLNTEKRYSFLYDYKNKISNKIHETLKTTEDDNLKQNNKNTNNLTNEISLTILEEDRNNDNIYDNSNNSNNSEHQYPFSIHEDITENNINKV